MTGSVVLSIEQDRIQVVLSIRYVNYYICENIIIYNYRLKYYNQIIMSRLKILGG